MNHSIGYRQKLPAFDNWYEEALQLDELVALWGLREAWNIKDWHLRISIPADYLDVRKSPAPDCVAFRKIDETKWLCLLIPLARWPVSLRQDWERDVWLFFYGKAHRCLDCEQCPIKGAVHYRTDCPLQVHGVCGVAWCHGEELVDELNLPQSQTTVNPGIIAGRLAGIGIKSWGAMKEATAKLIRESCVKSPVLREYLEGRGNPISPGDCSRPIPKKS
jgi:hypothetical protein